MEELKEIQNYIKKLKKDQIKKIEIAKIVMRHDEYLCLAIVFTIFAIYFVDLFKPLLGINILSMIISLGSYTVPIITALAKHRDKIDSIKSELERDF